MRLFGTSQCSLCIEEDELWINILQQSREQGDHQFFSLFKGARRSKCTIAGESGREKRLE